MSNVFKSKESFIEWLKAAGIRAVKTAAQAAAAVIGTTATMGGVDWKIVGSTALLAGILSMITSLGGLPEVSQTESMSSGSTGSGTTAA
jgi:hypothetical protein